MLSTGLSNLPPTPSGTTKAPQETFRIELSSQQPLDLASVLDQLPEPIGTDAIHLVVTYRIEATPKVGSKPPDQAILSSFLMSPPEAAYSKLPPSTKIEISNAETSYFVYPWEIIYCQAQDNYTKLYLDFLDKPVLVAKPLKYWEQALKNYGCFFRCHQSFLIHLGHVKGICTKHGQEVLLSQGYSAFCARKKVGTLRDLIKTWWG